MSAYLYFAGTNWCVFNIPQAYLEHYRVPELPKLKKFVVSVLAWSDASVLGCTDATRAAPHLEEFEVKVFWMQPQRSKRECIKAVRCPHHHLKVLKLLGYYGRMSELELVRYFLENATALEKIIVDPWCQDLVTLTPSEIQEGEIARNFAKLQLESEVPPHIELDGISELPDEIVVHILSFLSFKEAAATSVLSKRWLHLWTYFPRLDFDGTKLVEKIELYPKLYKEMNEKFVRWINNTLPMCKAQRLDRFCILFAIDKFVPHDIDKWLEFAFARKVQRLELDLRVGLDELYSDVDDCYAFPGQLLLRNVCQPHLDNLPPLWHNFKNVKVLLLKAVNVSDKVLEFFLHNCPFLEEMVVHGSDALVNLQVVGPSLKLKLLEVVDIAGSTLCTQMLDVISPWVSCVLSQLEVLKLFVRIGWKYLEHYRVPELPKLKKFVVSAFAWSDASVLGCTDAMRAAAHLEEFELKNSSGLAGHEHALLKRHRYF
ncbi:hypothetical protein T459_12637 [Capsicum annuum]|uniref:F-box domain-containing protein n=1 Tax=Capsicum annuum TaxID=4072 RepID=A0A2G2ZQH2_CAPAN|nr:hypothetical protein T459_12637 [Capsicum annuum]